MGTLNRHGFHGVNESPEPIHESVGDLMSTVARTIA